MKTLVLSKYTRLMKQLSTGTTSLEKTLTTADERAPSDFKDTKDKVTVLGCAKATGTHMLKLAVLGKSNIQDVLKV